MSHKDGTFERVQIPVHKPWLDPKPSRVPHGRQLATEVLVEDTDCDYHFMVQVRSWALSIQGLELRTHFKTAEFSKNKAYCLSRSHGAAVTMPPPAQHPDTGSSLLPTVPSLRRPAGYAGGAGRGPRGRHLEPHQGAARGVSRSGG